MKTESARFTLDDTHLNVGSHAYRLSSIGSVEVKSSSVNHYAAKVLFFALSAVTIVWLLCPDGYAQLFSPLAFLCGAVFSHCVFGRHSLRIKMLRLDNLASHWITISSGNSDEACESLQTQAEQISRLIAGNKEKTRLARLSIA
ncbi:hypothetical protein LRP49_01180 [Enterovibrio sp. ZSDZ35]|uniref:Uncharacterized protein n=1 Tax=Enterovibrio qingdaonensis TaxID=2899818 RepID=A0ABT5QFN9_9GAMM|nr:hypothetical protein [Enterovibrio sp. ZSDZ35]MDD1779795.1 hypothetical protein [Enterovibrio sp. ZSDZ35]